jgi:hypothetical protein
MSLPDVLAGGWNPVPGPGSWSSAAGGAPSLSDLSWPPSQNPADLITYLVRWLNAPPVAPPRPSGDTLASIFNPLLSSGGVAGAIAPGLSQAGYLAGRWNPALLSGVQGSVSPNALSLSDPPWRPSLSAMDFFDIAASLPSAPTAAAPDNPPRQSLSDLRDPSAYGGVPASTAAGWAQAGYPGAGPFTQTSGSGLAPFARFASLTRFPSLSDSLRSDDIAGAYHQFVEPASMSAGGLPQGLGGVPPDDRPSAPDFGKAYGLNDWVPDPALAASSPPIVLAQAGRHQEPGEPEEDPYEKLKEPEGGLGDWPRTIDGIPIPQQGDPGLMGRSLPFPSGGAPPGPVRPTAGPMPSGAVGAGPAPLAAGSIAGSAKGGGAGGGAGAVPKGSIPAPGTGSAGGWGAVPPSGSGLGAPGLPSGRWVTTNEDMPPRSAAYQAQITGRPATESFLQNGVKFDGFDGTNLLEMKGPGYAKHLASPEGFKHYFQGKAGMVAQAKRQHEASEGFPVIWHFAEPEMAAAFRGMLENEGVTGITVVVTPPSE